MEKNDLIIIGAGPGGFGAAVYAVRYNLKTLLIGKALGGMMAEAHLIENYPGFPPTPGIQLAQKFKETAEKLGTKVIIGEEIVEIKKAKNYFEIRTPTGKAYRSKALILALGTKKRKLDIEGEEYFLGKGISYCYTCDAAFFKGKAVGVIGGANSAAMAALALAEQAKNVTIMYRRDKLRCDPVLLKRVKKNPRIKIIYGVDPEKVEGKQFLESVTLKKSTKTGLKKVSEGKVPLDGLFIEIGEIPMDSLTAPLGIELEKGFIKVSDDMSTNVPGVFAAGDITTGSLEFRQIITAAAEGAVAAQSAFNYISSL